MEDLKTGPSNSFLEEMTYETYSSSAFFILFPIEELSHVLAKEEKGCRGRREAREGLVGVLDGGAGRVSRGVEEPQGGNCEGRPLDGGVGKVSQGIEEPQGGIREGRLGLI